MRTYPDETLDYYADRFMLLGLARHGLNLEQYLANPERSERLGDYYRQRMDRHRISIAEYLTAPGRCEEKALEEELPLPAQHAAILRIWAAHDTGLTPPHWRVEPHWSDAHLVDIDALLAQWRAECDAAERPLAHLPQRNGVIVEPLHHRRHERRHNPNADFTKKGAVK